LVPQRFSTAIDRKPVYVIKRVYDLVTELLKSDLSMK
jgi:hypothetical protein